MDIQSLLLLSNIRQRIRFSMNMANDNVPNIGLLPRKGFLTAESIFVRRNHCEATEK